jgi:hypothetical protein
MAAAAGFDRIADFRFARLLGSGSFAHTYEAERDGERFAVKVFHELPATAEAQQRFRREVSSLRIEHPNLAEYCRERRRSLWGATVGVHCDALSAGRLAAPAPCAMRRVARSVFPSAT